ncbi:acyl-CoA desaturase, partial [bacterium]|nr:acyl-CoA desaturase [bacterium]
YSDKDEDVHSPGIHGLFWSHVGWILCAKNMPTDENVVRDLAKYPELRFINRYHVLVPTLLGVFLFYFGVFLHSAWPSLGVTGFQLLIWGFFVSTVILYHLTFSINSLAHVFGSRRFDTPDKSRNNAILGLLLMGEGWHNNHHRYPGAESQGIFWWEIDITHYILKGLSFLGVVWELRKPPETAHASAS